jgi:two-component system sensor histidine kinase KdpD
MADYEMLRSTVKELLENAGKYATTGSPITVRASETSSEVTVSVHNRGPVIALEERERIFERFYRSPSHRHSAPGTGLGLSVARHAIEAHGGHIWVISGEHEGTTFYFSLPRGLDTPRTQRLEARLCREEY